MSDFIKDLLAQENADLRGQLEQATARLAGLRQALQTRRDSAERFLDHEGECVSASAYAIVGCCDALFAVLDGRA